MEDGSRKRRKREKEKGEENGRKKRRRRQRREDIEGGWKEENDDRVRKIGKMGQRIPFLFTVSLYIQLMGFPGETPGGGGWTRSRKGR